MSNENSYLRNKIYKRDTAITTKDKFKMCTMLFQKVFKKEILKTLNKSELIQENMSVC
jgi:hypothetical protein